MSAAFTQTCELFLLVSELVCILAVYYVSISSAMNELILSSLVKFSKYAAPKAGDVIAETETQLMPL